ncbi:hypothetical protein BKA70DRAFT_1433653 [Coprinopsis sp. MPI-PUGE-AT-0042]|nr:hypothetical protein BKA70DRAFT_1433653 [Coprinopsis sp. MPI-PUGE-AT-0042]
MDDLQDKEEKVATGADDLTSSFHNGLSSLQNYTHESFDKISNGYAGPALSFAEESFAKKPIVTVFLILLSIFSCIPIITFIVFSCLAVLVFAVTALISTIVVSVLTLLFFVSILLLTIGLMALFAAGITVALVASFLAVRLVLLIRQDGFKGLSTFINDVQGYITSAIPKRPFGTSPSNDGTSASSEERHEPKKHDGDSEVKIARETHQ